MAGASMKDIKLRIKSVESTMQITKAMQLVASSKLRRARDRMDMSKPFFAVSRETMANLARYLRRDVKNVYTRGKADAPVLYIVVAGDRGLAGGYNANVFKALSEDAGEQAFAVLPVGKKALEKYRPSGAPLVSEAYDHVEGFSVHDAFLMARQIMTDFASGRYGGVKLVYTNFTSMLSQNASVAPILPIAPFAEESPREQMVIEPDPEEFLEEAVNVYLSGLIYSAVCNSFASELGARRTAMDAATKNASEMIDGLKLNYNRARQGAITQELTEIVAGAEH